MEFLDEREKRVDSRVFITGCLGNARCTCERLPCSCILSEARQRCSMCDKSFSQKRMFVAALQCEDRAAGGPFGSLVLTLSQMKTCERLVDLRDPPAVLHHEV